MARTQKSLFGDDGDVRPDTGGLLLVSRPDGPLTPAQRAFNRLVVQVEGLRERLQQETRRLDKALAYYGEHLHPRRKRCNALRKDLIRALAPFLDGKQLKRKRDRETLQEIIAEQMDAILDDEGALEDADLRAVFERIHGVGYEALVQEEMDDVRSTMESMFADLGVEVDLSDLRPDMSPEEMAARAAEMAERIRRQTEENEGAFRRPGRRKSRKQLQREEQMRQAEEVRNKSIASIYRQLAKVLHPDLEQDDARRQRKVVLMQELTTAYRRNDLHTLLRLELEWIQREQGNLDRLTEEKLVIYNEVLKDQAAELKREIADLPLHPRYQPIVVSDGPFDFRVRASDPAEARRLDGVISMLEALLVRMQTGDIAKEVHVAVQEYRNAHQTVKWRRDFEIPF